MRTVLTACIAAWLLSTSPARAETFPAKPVKVIVTFTVGGAADLTARLIGDRLAEMWKQQVVVENRIGAGGRIGVEAVHRSAADGYTLLLFSNTHVINQALYKDQGFDLLKDFTALGLTTSTPMVLAVNPRVSIKSVKDFTELLRSQPGKIDYTTCGVATAHHFAMELYKHATKTYAVHIPHRGCSPAVADAVGGQIDFVVASLAAVLPFARQGKLRVVGLTSEKRSPTAPEYPTFRESGLPELQDFAVENYYGFMAPGGTPPEVAAKIEADIRQVLSVPEFVARLSNAGLDLFQYSPPQMMALVRADLDKFSRAIQLANIKPE
ncbi:MAG TPA: tripartite tricarboxylate transporter substrate binding protein [Burkholderiales bacterium]|nr:tripartite tricarboxylate transporter substrate binding protein [Burkholderiales bacterium]